MLLGSFIINVIRFLLLIRLELEIDVFRSLRKLRYGILCMELSMRWGSLSPFPNRREILLQMILSSIKEDNSRSKYFWVNPSKLQETQFFIIILVYLPWLSTIVAADDAELLPGWRFFNPLNIQIVQHKSKHQSSIFCRNNPSSSNNQVQSYQFIRSSLQHQLKKYIDLT